MSLQLDSSAPTENTYTPNREIDALCWQFYIRLIALSSRCDEINDSTFQVPFCTSQDLDYLNIIIYIQYMLFKSIHEIL
jgi:hypothetical protein